MSLLAIFLPTLAVLVCILLDRNYAARTEARIAAEHAALRAEAAAEALAVRNEMTGIRWSATGNTNSLRSELAEIRAELALLRSDLRQMPRSRPAANSTSLTMKKSKPPLPTSAFSRPVPSASPSSRPAGPAA